MNWTTKIITDGQIEEAIEEVSKCLFCGLRDETAEHFAEHHKGDSTTILGYSEGKLVGLLNIRWKANYPPFQAKEIPLIHYIEVVFEHRHKGFGTKLMNEAEVLISEKSNQAGICVNISQEFGVPMGMYARRGYILVETGQRLELNRFQPGNLLKILTMFLFG